MKATNEKNNLNIAEKYYENMLNKKFESMAECLEPNVIFIGPLSEMSGKDNVASAAKNLMEILMNINIRAKFSAGNQVMMAYDFTFPEPVGNLRASVLMDFNSDKISKIELFYDGRPFETNK